MEINECVCPQANINHVFSIYVDHAMLPNTLVGTLQFILVSLGSIHFNSDLLLFYAVLCKINTLNIIWEINNTRCLSTSFTLVLASFRKNSLYGWRSF